MKSDARWMRILAIRVLVNAIVGGLWFSLVGAFCGGVAGAFLTFLISIATGEFGVGMIFNRLTIFDSILGLSSGIVGAFIFAIAAWRTAPSQLLTPFHELRRRVFLGQVFGTLVGCASFTILIFIKVRLTDADLANVLQDDGVYSLLGAPILMICGAIAGALTKRDLPQHATLKAE